MPNEIAAIFQSTKYVVTRGTGDDLLHAISPRESIPSCQTGEVILVARAPLFLLRGVRSERAARAQVDSFMARVQNILQDKSS